MKRIFCKIRTMAVALLSISTFLHIGVLGWALTSCSSDHEAPHIESVWLNMVSRPIEQAVCAYPGQTVCLRGGGFDDLQQVVVNGTEINLNTLFVYESASNITFQIPSDVNTEGDIIKVVTANGEASYPFVVRPAAEQPVISAFSATTLIGGRTLSITGSNLEGATEVWLPLTFGGRAQCSFDPAQISNDNTIYVIVPEDVDFATGYCEVVMEKHDAARGIDYTEKVYSKKTDFRN